MRFYFSFTAANYENPEKYLTIKLGMDTLEDDTIVNVNVQIVQAQRVFVYLQHCLKNVNCSYKLF